jgi:phosphoadenosine phosphosulfate reductase
MTNPLQRHEKAILFFSGGKDSLVCLHLLRPHWERILVVWANPGEALPEMRRQMDAVRAMVPHFLEVTSDLDADIARNGLPVDLMPAQNSMLRAQIEGLPTSLMRPWQACCMNNLWEPMRALMERLLPLGYTLAIRGQKNADPKTPRTRSGDRFGDLELWYPIEDWSEQQVFAYLRENGIEIPDHYAFFNASLDCWACTAHNGEHVGKLEYLRQRHPEKAIELRRRLIVIKEAVMEEVRNMNHFLGDE